MGGFDRTFLIQLERFDCSRLKYSDCEHNMKIAVGERKAQPCFLFATLFLTAKCFPFLKACGDPLTVAKLWSNFKL